MKNLRGTINVAEIDSRFSAESLEVDKFESDALSAQRFLLVGETRGIVIIM